MQNKFELVTYISISIDVIMEMIEMFGFDPSVPQMWRESPADAAKRPRFCHRLLQTLF